MLDAAEFHHAVEGLSPRKRWSYEGAVMVMTVLVFAAGAVLLSGLSIWVIQRLFDADLSSENLIAGVIMPAMMAYVFVIAGAPSEIDVKYGTGRNIFYSARQGLVRGLIAGFVTVVAIDAMGQVLLARAIYGPLHFQEEIFSFCGLRVLIHGAVLCVPIAIGCALFYGYAVVGSQLVLRVIRRLPG